MAKSSFDTSKLKEIKVSEPFMISETNAIIVKLIEYNEKRYLDIRTYYQDDNEEFRPTAKGLWIPLIDMDNPTICKDILNMGLDFIKLLTEVG